MLIGLLISLWQQKEVQRNLLTATIQRERAEQNVDLLAETIDEVLEEYQEILDSGESISKRQLPIISKILAVHKRLIDQEAERLEVTVETLTAYRRMAHIYLKTGKNDQARTICRQAVRLWEIVDDEVRQRELQPYLVDILFQEVVIEMLADNHTGAELLLDQALPLLEACQHELTPDEFGWRMQFYCRHKGLILMDELKHAESTPFFLKSMEFAASRFSRTPNDDQRKRDYAIALQDLGDNSGRLGDYQNAATFLEASLKQLESTAEAASPLLQYRKAYLLSDIALAYSLCDRQDEAGDRYLESLEILQALLLEDPEDAFVFNRMNNTLMRQGKFHVDQEEFAAAKAVFLQGLELAPSISQHRVRVESELYFHYQLADLLAFQFDDEVAATEHFEQAIRIGEAAVLQYPDDKEIRSSLVRTYRSIGKLRAAAEQPELALESLRKSSEHANAILFFNADQPQFQRMAIGASRRAVELAVELGETEGAIKLCTGMAKMAPNAPSVQYSSGRLLAGLPQQIVRGSDISVAELKSIKELAHGLALEHLKRAIEYGFDDPSSFEKHQQWSELKNTAEFEAIVEPLLPR